MLALGDEIAQEVARRKEVPKIAKIVKRLLPLAIKDLRKLPEDKMITGIQMLIVALGRVLYPDAHTMTVQLKPSETMNEDTPGSLKGMTPDFGSEIEGSNPSPGATTE